jgi:flagellin-like protein
MNFKELLTDDDAVSPVIGVILMVAITVILAAVIATFVLGLGEQVSETAPQASFEFDFEGSSGNPGNLDVTHDGGDTITAKNLYIRGTVSNTGSWDSLPGSYGANSEISAGNSVTLSSVAAGADAKVIWEPEGGDNSATLAEWEGPDA